MTDDGSEPLKNSRHERFAQAVVRGESDMKAYVTAGYSPKAANQNATELRGNTGITKRIAWMHRQAAQDAFLTVAEKRKFLADVVRTPLSEIDERSPLCQSAKYHVQGGIRGRLRRGDADEGNEEVEPETTTVEIKMVDKLKAIDLDDELAGDVSADVEIIVRIGK
jgi:phage terminase small subunit